MHANYPCQTLDPNQGLEKVSRVLRSTATDCNKAKLNFWRLAQLRHEYGSFVSSCFLDECSRLKAVSTGFPRLDANYYCALRGEHKANREQTPYYEKESGSAILVSFTFITKSMLYSCYCARNCAQMVPYSLPSTVQDVTSRRQYWTQYDGFV